MADADVPITAGAGTKIDTRTVGAGTDEHRQVVVVGDPTTATAVQAVDDTLKAGLIAGATYTATSGTVINATSTVTTGNIARSGNLTVYIYGTYAGVNVAFEASPDNTNWFSWPMQREQTSAIEFTSGVLTANSSVAWSTDAPGFSFFRVRATAWTSGTANVVINAGTLPFSPVVSAAIPNALPAGTNNIGDVDVLTVPAPLSTTGGGTEATAHRVTLANDSTGVVTVKQATAANLKALIDQGAPAAQANAWYVRPRQLATYMAGYRLVVATAGGTYLAFTFTANTDKQLATVYHTAASTKTLRLRYASITLIAGAVGVYEFELRALSAATAPATGNPAVTPRQGDPADAAAEATCLALPTTAGSEAAANSPLSPTLTWNSAAAAATADPARANQELVLYDGRQGPWERKPPTLRAGVAEGLAIVGRVQTAVLLNFACFMEFTEE